MSRQKRTYTQCKEATARWRASPEGRAAYNAYMRRYYEANKAAIRARRAAAAGRGRGEELGGAECRVVATA